MYRNLQLPEFENFDPMQAMALELQRLREILENTAQR